MHCSTSLHHLLSVLGMARFDILRVRATVWKWLCRCPDAIRPEEYTSSKNEFFTPPSSPVQCVQEQHVGDTPDSVSAVISPASDVPRLLSPAQTARLRRRHAEVVRQLTTPPPVVTPPPPAPLKAYQRPIKVYRPNWAS